MSYTWNMDVKMMIVILDDDQNYGSETHWHYLIVKNTARPL